MSDNRAETRWIRSVKNYNLILITLKQVANVAEAYVGLLNLVKLEARTGKFNNVTPVLWIYVIDGGNRRMLALKRCWHLFRALKASSNMNPLNLKVWKYIDFLLVLLLLGQKTEMTFSTKFKTALKNDAGKCYSLKLRYFAIW